MIIKIKCMCISVAGGIKANLNKKYKWILKRSLELVESFLLYFDYKYISCRIVQDCKRCKLYNLLQCYTHVPYWELKIIYTRGCVQFNLVSLHFRFEHSHFSIFSHLKMEVCYLGTVHFCVPILKIRIMFRFRWVGKMNTYT